jgi:hypothetical protein
MKLTKLSAAPTLAPQAALGRRCRLMPAKSATAAGTASQLIPRVRPTMRRAGLRLADDLVETFNHRSELGSIGPPQAAADALGRERSDLADLDP